MPGKALGLGHSQNNQPLAFALGATYFGIAPALGLYPTLSCWGEGLECSPKVLDADEAALLGSHLRS
jgi:hypothetical protein